MELTSLVRSSERSRYDSGSEKVKRGVEPYMVVLEESDTLFLGWSGSAIFKVGVGFHWGSDDALV